MSSFTKVLWWSALPLTETVSYDVQGRSTLVGLFSRRTLPRREHRHMWFEEEGLLDAWRCLDGVLACSSLLLGEKKIFEW